MQQLQADNRRLQAQGLGTVPRLALSVQARKKYFPSFIDIKGHGKPLNFNGAFGDRFSSGLVPQPTEIIEARLEAEFGAEADEVDRVEDFSHKVGQILLRCSSFTKDLFDTIRGAPTVSVAETWRLLTKITTPSPLKRCVAFCVLTCPQKMQR
eukprot:6116351-Amphidinium_carterae.1